MNDIASKILKDKVIQKGIIEYDDRALYIRLNEILSERDAKDEALSQARDVMMEMIDDHYSYEDHMEQVITTINNILGDKT